MVLKIIRVDYMYIVYIKFEIISLGFFHLNSMSKEFHTQGIPTSVKGIFTLPTET